MDGYSKFMGHGHKLGNAIETNSSAPFPYRSRPDRKSSSYCQPPTLPQQIRDDIKQLQQYIRQVWNTTCHKCGANITSEIGIKETIMQWFNKSASRRGETSISTRKCGNCYAITCLGCGEAARKTEPRRIKDHYISWCCLDGRILTMWMMLCRFDTIENERRVVSEQAKQLIEERTTRNTSSGVSGTGYATPSTDPWVMMTGGAWDPKIGMHAVRLKEEDPRMEDFVSWIMEMVTFTLPGPNSEDLLPVLLAMLELSLIIDKAAELLRNDSLDDVMKRSTVYQSVLNLVKKIGAHRVLLRLVQEDRFSKTRSSGLENISFAVDSNGGTQATPQSLILVNNGRDQSLAQRLENLATQSKLLLDISDAEPDLRYMCRQITSAYKLIMKSEAPDSAPKVPSDQWTTFHKAYSLTFNDAIRGDFLPELRAESGKIERQLQYSGTVTDRNKRILSECANMRTSLDDGTFVIVADSRPDMLRALMVGPEDTPYANGLFEFDILLPADYPRSPPKIYIKLPYPIMVNINLHPDSKVCLSLLGTHYTGDTTESWQPGISTILQCLLSIRAMILISESLGQNSPVDMGTSPGETASFDRSVQAQTIWFFMLNWLVDKVKRNGVWKAVITKHFTARQAEILRTVKQWAERNPDLRSWTGHLAGDEVPKLGPMTEYVPGFHGRRTVDLVQQLEHHLPIPRSV